MTFDWRGHAADSSPDLTMALDDTWMVRYVSQVGAARYGFDAADYVDKPLPLDLIHPDDLDYALGALGETDRRDGDHMPSQIRIRDSVGGLHDVEIGAHSSYDADGKRSIVLAFRPIERRHLAPTRRHDLEMLVQLVTTACAAAGPDEIERVVAESLGQLGTYLGADTVMLGLVDHDASVLAFDFEWSLQPGRSWRANHPTLALADLLWDAGTLPDRGFVFQGDLSLRTDRTGLAALAEFGIESLVDVVVAAKDRPAAVLAVLFADDGRGWDDSLASQVRMIAEVLTVTVHRLADFRSLRHQVNHDALTGLPNREYLLSRMRESTDAMTLFFCDLDGFKAVNDVWGHSVGNQVLTEVAHRITGAVRGADFVARVGGDEFVVLSGIGDDEAERVRLAQRIEHAVSSLDRIGLASLSISVSVGFATRLPGEAIEPVLERADSSMYSTKKVRRGRTARRSEAAFIRDSRTSA